MKIEIELFEGDFKYRDIEIWAYEEDGCYYRIDKDTIGFVKLSDAIQYIDDKLGDINDN